MAANAAFENSFDFYEKANFDIVPVPIYWPFIKEILDYIRDSMRYDTSTLFTVSVCFRKFYIFGFRFSYNQESCTGKAGRIRIHKPNF